MLTKEQVDDILKNHCVNLRFHARGGQGGVTASNLCVEAFIGYGVCVAIRPSIKLSASITLAGLFMDFMFYPKILTLDPLGFRFINSGKV